MSAAASPESRWDDVHERANRGEWPAACAEILRLSTAREAASDPRPLLALVAKIPREFLLQNARICLDAGMAAAREDRVPFLGWLELAWDGYVAAGDVMAATMTAAVALRCIASDFSDLRRMDAWCERVRQGIAQGVAPASNDERALVGAGILAATHFLPEHGFDDASIAAHEKTTADLLLGDEALDPHVAVMAAESLLEQYAHSGQRNRTEHLALRFAARFADPALRPLPRARWNFWLASEFRFLDRPAKAAAHAAEARRVGIEHGLRWIAFHVLRSELRDCIDRADTEAARAGLAELQQLLDFERALDVGDFYHVRGWLSLLEDDAASALEDFRIAREAAERGRYNVAVNFYRSMEAYALIALGDEPQAIAILEALAYRSTERYQAVQRGLIALAQACRASAEDETAYRACLVRGFGIAREHDLLMLFRPLPDLIARLCSDALEYGIETNFVERLVRARGLAPPPDAGRAWPWPVKILTLGAFEVLVADQAVGRGGKAQRKVLDLVKVLVAHGGRDVPAERLVDALWPDPEDAGSRGALDVAITRLRKLLGSGDAIIVSEGKVSFDPALVWVDSLALEQRMRRWEAAGPDAFSQLEVARRPTADRLFSLYRGHFLNREPDAPWLLPMRERLWGALGRVLERLGSTLQRQGAWDEAASLYRRATELDLLTESFYRNLMLCYRETGRNAEAIDAYRRCRQNLSVILGIEPSAETEALRRTLG